MNIIQIAKMIKDEEAINILENPENFPKEWIENAKERMRGKRR